MTLAEPPPAAPMLTGGPRFAAFCDRFIRQTKGRWAQQPLHLEGWQRGFWDEALEVNPDTGLRIYTEVGQGLPTKNGKSTQASGAGLYFLTADGEAEPEVIIGAAARPQARIIFGQARRMALASPRLLDQLRVMQHSIEAPRSGGIMRTVSADALLQHGPNPSANIIDEIHAHKDDGLYTALTKSGAAREQPFTLWITTNGPGQLLADLKGQMVTGPGELEIRPGLRIYRDRTNGVLIYWYGADQDADIEDPAVWRLANPASWLRDGTYLARQFANMKARGALLEWRMYHLNMDTDRIEAWLPLSAWKACADSRDANGRLAHPFREELPLGIGVYKSADAAVGAIVAAQRQGDRVIVRHYHFPTERPTGQASSIAMRAKLTELRSAFPTPQAKDPKTKFPLAGPAIAFTSYNFEESAALLSTEGLNMVKFPLYASTMGPASTLTHELIATGRLIHEGDPILTEHIAKTDALLTDRGMQIVAAKAPDYNPGAIALAAAVAMAMQEAPVPFTAKRRVGVGF